MPYVQLIGLWIFLWCSQAAQAQHVVYDPLVEHQSITFNEFRLRAIHFKPDTTTVVLEWYAERGGNSLQVAPPKHPHAMKIVIGDKRYNMLQAENIAYAPDYTEVKSGEHLWFRLHFPPIDPSSAATLNLLEGVEPSSSSFDFYGVHLLVGKSAQYSLRFQNKAAFERHWKAKRLRLHPLEGFWKIEQEVKPRQRGRAVDLLESRQDTIALVKEGQYLRAYYLDGQHYGIDILQRNERQYWYFWTLQKANRLRRRCPKVLQPSFEMGFSIPKRYLKALAKNRLSSNKRLRGKIKWRWQYIGDESTSMVEE